MTLISLYLLFAQNNNFNSVIFFVKFNFKCIELFLNNLYIYIYIYIYIYERFMVFTTSLGELMGEQSCSIVKYCSISIKENLHTHTHTHTHIYIYIYI